jgi:hypothetical protein
MKKLFVTVLAVFQIVVVFAQTTGTLNVSVATASTGGTYSPKNVFVIWIEDASGNFVKTLSAYAERRIQYLYKWSASTSAKNSQYNRVDAVTGATLGNHGTRTGIWNGTDYNKKLVADGTYYVCFELTDKHAQGNYSRFAFTKGADNKVTPANSTGFSNISIQWTASGTTAVNEIQTTDEIRIFPNPSKDIFRVEGTGITATEVLTLSGNVLFHNGNKLQVDLSNYPDGIYLLRITRDDRTIVKKVVKK